MTRATAVTEPNDISGRLQAAGVFYFPGLINSALYRHLHQLPSLARILRDARMILKQANGRCGIVGWVADPDHAPGAVVVPFKRGRYTNTNPENGRPWPALPESIRQASLISAGLCGWANFFPHSCHISVCEAGAEQTGTAQEDTSGGNLVAPLVTFSIGDTAIMEIGGLKRRDPLEEVPLESGDCLVFTRESRLFPRHLARTLPGTSDDLEEGGRLDITVRQFF